MIRELDVAAGRLALSPLPGRGGDYSGDLQRLAEWAPDLVVSMTSEAEMQRCGAGSLGRDLNAMGRGWAAMPVADFGVPAADMQGLWQELSSRALGVLRAQGRVLVHCRGGCGRSGMIVLRLMIEAGEAPDAALARLRAIRPCAVETKAQMGWALEARLGG